MTICLKYLFSTMALYRCEVLRNLMPFQLGLMCLKVYSFDLLISKFTLTARRKNWVDPFYYIELYNDKYKALWTSGYTFEDFGGRSI